MERRFCAAIIGFGGMGFRHYKAYNMRNVDVVAICEIDRKKVKEKLPDYSEDKIFSDAGKMLKSQHFDIISVVTNGPTHAPLAVMASEYGVPNVICEKPIATNLRDAQKAVDTCKKNNTRLVVNLIRRWSPNHNKLKNMIQDGMIGKVRHIYVQCGSTGLGNMGIHFFDSMRFYADSEVEWVVGFLDKTGTPNPRGSQFKDPGGYGILQFQNGVRAFLDISEDTGVRHVFEIVGEYGRVVIEEWGDKWEIFVRSEEDKKLPLTRYIAPLKELPFTLETKFDIVDLTSRCLSELISGSPLSADDKDGKKSLEIVVAFHVSDRNNNAKVRFPLGDEVYDIDIPIA